MSNCESRGFPAPSCDGIVGTGPTIPSVSSPPYSLSSASSSSEPICSALAIITCLPSLWHIRGRHQAASIPYPSLSSSFSALISAPTSPVHWRVQVASCPTLFLSQSWKQRGAAAMEHKILKIKDILLSVFYLEPAVQCLQALCWVVVVNDFSPAGWLLQFEQNPKK